MCGSGGQGGESPPGVIFCATMSPDVVSPRAAWSSPSAAQTQVRANLDVGARPHEALAEPANLDRGVRGKSRHAAAARARRQQARGGGVVDVDERAVWERGGVTDTCSAAQ